MKFQDSGYHTESVGEPLDVYAVDVNGRALTIFVDSHEAKGDDAKAFFTTAAAILEKLTFTA